MSSEPLKTIIFYNMISDFIHKACMWMAPTDAQP